MYSFSPEFFGSFDIAQTYARHQQHGTLTPWHLLYGMAKNPNLNCSQPLSNQLAQIQKHLANCPQVTGDMPNIKPDSTLMSWLQAANAQATESGQSEIAETHIVHTTPPFITKQLGKHWYQPDQTHNNSDNPPLPTFLINLNQQCQAGKIDPVIGREREIRSLLEVLSRKNKNNPILLGEAGVGKTAVVEGLAHHITAGDVPEKFKNHTVYSLDLSILMADTQYRGAFEKQLQKLFQFVKSQHGKAIIFFDEIHMLIGAGKTEGGIDGANLLKPALARGELQCIGATTYQEYQRYIMSDSALDRRFRGIKIAEPSAEATIEILLGLRDRLEAHHGLSITNQAIYSAVFLSAQYVWDRNFPDKAIDLIDEACAAKKFSIESMPSHIIALEEELRRKKTLAKTDRADDKLINEINTLEAECHDHQQRWQQDVKKLKEFAALKKHIDTLTSQQDMAEKSGDYETASRLKYAEIPALSQNLAEYNINTSLSEDDVADVLARRTGIPKSKILTTKQEKILTLESFLHQRVLGQTEQLSEIAQILVAAYAGLSDSSQPLGSFLLTGPSGVGKTETAKSLCEFFFDTKDRLIRIDLSEYSEKHAVAKLIGAPSGYVGYDDGGQLTEAIRKNPYSVILFDEVEKAHPDFCDILLQILDDGRLTDNKGRVVSFAQTCIILTSNSKNITAELKPEVLGRIDAILNYNHLTAETLRRLVAHEVELLNDTLKPKQLKISLSDSMVTKLLQQGCNDEYGARPLKHTFKKVIARPLAHQILAQDLQNTDIHFDLNQHDEVNLVYASHP